MAITQFLMKISKLKLLPLISNFDKNYGNGAIRNGSSNKHVVMSKFKELLYRHLIACKRLRLLAWMVYSHPPSECAQNVSKLQLSQL